MLGKYILGVRPTAANYESFEVRPCVENLGLGAFSGKVPTPRGDIEVCVSETYVSVLSELGGGKLIVGGKEYAVEKGKEIKVKL